MNKREKEVQQAFLDNEKAVLKSLERNYQDALAEINGKLEVLMARQDADMAHVIYQIEHQKALKTQVKSILENLQNNEFESISEYLANSYTDGFVGTMYDIHGQGIPLIVPIDQKQVIEAIQHETKLTSKLYDELGLDIKELQKNIAGEISRGISSGQGYPEMARNIANYAKIPKNRAMTIARTESHRIQCKATSDAQFKAKEKGADVVKQWDAALDGDTRPNHRRLDGQIRELEERFEVGKFKPRFPGDFGTAGEDCNCRCALLQRARWALDESELETLKKRAEYFELDKEDDFKSFEKKYLKATETLKNMEENGIIISGAASGARNPFGKKAEEHAERYYGLVRSMTTDVAKISKATGMTEEDIQSIKNFIFLEKHDLGGKKLEYFKPDYMMAESWQRLTEGKPEQHDITMLKHELMERELMKEGLSQEEAHKRTSQKYNYSKEAGEYYAKIKKYKKE